MNNLEVCNLYPFFRSIIESDFQNESFTVCKSTPLLEGFHTEIFLRGFGSVGQSFTFLETNISFLYSTDKISHIIKSFFIMFVSHAVLRKNIFFPFLMTMIQYFFGEHIWSSICIYKSQNFAFPIMTEVSCKKSC